MRPIKVLAEPGGILNAVLPAAGAARAATAYRLMDAVLGALAQAQPNRIMAAGDGCSLLHTFFCHDDQREPFVFVDMMRGSWGARPNADGLDGTSLTLANASAVPAEIIEMEYPLRVEYYGYIPDTCGAGRHRGGMGRNSPSSLQRGLCSIDRSAANSCLTDWPAEMLGRRRLSS